MNDSYLYIFNYSFKELLKKKENVVIEVELDRLDGIERRKY